MSQENKQIQELATLVAEIIRRMGASYGSAEDWRADFRRAVKIMEEASK
jgi:hypothetical protein